MRGRAPWSALTVAWALVLVGLASIPGDRVPEPLLISTDTLRHALAFAVLTGLALRAWPGRPAAVAGGAFLLGGAIEAWQGAMPIGRTASVSDLVADALGILAALGVAALASRARAGW